MYLKAKRSSLRELMRLIEKFNFKFQILNFKLCKILSFCGHTVLRLAIVALRSWSSSFSSYRLGKWSGYLANKHAYLKKFNLIRKIKAKMRTYWRSPWIIGCEDQRSRLRSSKIKFQILNSFQHFGGVLSRWIWLRFSEALCILQTPAAPRQLISRISFEKFGKSLAKVLQKRDFAKFKMKKANLLFKSSKIKERDILRWVCGEMTSPKFSGKKETRTDEYLQKKWNHST